MSLITRCPACSTLFKVVPDQLRISDGWVRCGQCDEVFDANVHLQGERPAELATTPQTEGDTDPTEPAQPPVEVQEPAVDQSPESTEVIEDPEPALHETPEQKLAAQLDWPEESALERDPLMDVRPGDTFESGMPLNLELPERATDPAEEWSAPEDPQAEPVFESGLAERAVEAEVLTGELPAELPVRLPPPAETMPPSAAAPAPSFLRGATRASRWDHTWVKRSLWVLGSLLLLGLVVQIVVHERDRLAANLPDARPALDAVCTVVGCTIAPHRQIESVVIDSSAFVKIRGDVYRLNVSLKNTALIDIAAPSLELTLTDLQEQAMVRHVIASSDLGAKTGVLVAGSDLTAAIPLQVKAPNASDRISGYKLVAFYP
ncbi:MAG: hypothetical protein CFE44_06645 [Burkholderiales bacterium PBB4]|nr:MAG: hypothetical protein CFE44_06645 [Burkholderiales bacterium PBB4]